MSLRRFLNALKTAQRTIALSAPYADGLIKSLFSIFVICCIALTSPPQVHAKPFTFSFPAGWSLAGFVSGVGARETSEKRDAGVKPYTGRRISNDTLRMIYFHDQTVAIVELGPGKLLLNCELIETYDEDDTNRLLKQLSTINRPYGVTFPQMIKLMSQCQQISLPGKWLNRPHPEFQLHRRAIQPFRATIFLIFDSEITTYDCHINVDGVEKVDTPPESRDEDLDGWQNNAQARLDSGGNKAGLLGGSPLSLLQGIIPGTKWCGTGDIAANYHDLGNDRRMDRCCRTHDLCPTKIRAFTKRYNLSNNSIYSKSHCVCDDMLFDCLKATNTSAAHLMGHIYFNIVQVPCLEDAQHGREFRDAKKGF